MNVVKFVYVVCVLLVILSAGVSASTYYAKVNKTDDVAVNFTDIYAFNLGTVINDSYDVIFIGNETESYLSLVDSPVVFPWVSNGSVLALKIEINLSGVSYGNYSSFAIFSRSGSSTDLNYSFDFEVINVTPAKQDFIQLDVNRFVSTVCDLHLPVNLSQKVVIYNELMHNVSFSSDTNNFVQLPSNMVFAQKTETVDLLFNLPSGLGYAQYEDRVNFNLGDVEDQATFLFDIIQCDYPVNLDDCFLDCTAHEPNSDKGLNCLQRKSECWYYMNLNIQAARSEGIVNNTRIVEKNVTEIAYLQPLDIEATKALIGYDQTFKDLEGLRTDNAEIRRELVRLSNEYSALNQNFSEALYARVRDLVEYANEKDLETSDLEKRLANEKKTSIKKRLLWRIFLIFVVGGLVGLYIHYRNYVRLV